MLIGVLSLYNSQLPSAAVLRAFHDGMYISQAVTLKINHQMPVFRVLPFLCCFLLVNLQCKMLYCCMDFNFFFCISNIVAFKITFSTHLLFLSIFFQAILKYVQHYQQYLIFLLKFIVVKQSY